MRNLNSKLNQQKLTTLLEHAFAQHNVQLETWRQLQSLKNPSLAKGATRTGSAWAVGPTTRLSDVSSAAEVVDIESWVFSSVERAMEMASVMAEVVTPDASNVACVNGRRTRKLLRVVALVVLVVGVDILAASG